MESLRLLKNKLVVGQFANTDYNKEFTRPYAVGETVRVKYPQRWLITPQLGFSPQPINRRETTVTIDQIFGIHYEVDSIEEALRLERSEAQIRKEYIEPAMAQLAQEIDSRFCQYAYLHTPNIVGALGTDPTTFDAVSGASRQRLVELACPADNSKGMIIPPAVMRQVKNTAITYFNPASDISKQYKEGSVGRADGFDWYESMSLYSHTTSVWAGAVTVQGAGQTGSSLLVNCTTGDTFTAGDVISIAAVYAVNPMTRRRVNSATTKQFVILQSTVGAASAATLQIYPAIDGPGSQYQNVDALALNTAALTLFPGTTAPSTGPKAGIQGLALHPDAFALVGVDLDIPKACEMSWRRRDPETGISIAFLDMFDPIQRRRVKRFDVLLGFGTLFGENCAVRVACA
jgi:hypothetical protein